VLYYDQQAAAQLCRERAEELARAARGTRRPTGSGVHRPGRATTPLKQVLWLLRELRGSEADRAPAYRAP
jgi:hypothetical protein